MTGFRPTGKPRKSGLDNGSIMKLPAKPSALGWFFYYRYSSTSKNDLKTVLANQVFANPKC